MIGLIKNKNAKAFQRSETQLKYRLENLASFPLFILELHCKCANVVFKWTTMDCCNVLDMQQQYIRIGFNSHEEGFRSQLYSSQNRIRTP